MPSDWNRLMELIAGTPLTQREAQVVAAVARKTLGWRGKSGSDRISSSQLAELTGIGRNHVTETLAKLEARGIIARRHGGNGRVATIALNLSSKWATKPVPRQGQVNLSQVKDRSASKPVPRPGAKPVPLSGHTRGKGLNKQEPDTENRSLQSLAFDAWTAAGGPRLYDRERGALARNVTQLERKGTDPNLILATVKDLARKGDFTGNLQQRATEIQAEGGPCHWQHNRQGLTPTQLL